MRGQSSRATACPHEGCRDWKLVYMRLTAWNEGGAGVISNVREVTAVRCTCAAERCGALLRMPPDFWLQALGVRGSDGDCNDRQDKSHNNRIRLD